MEHGTVLLACSLAVASLGTAGCESDSNQAPPFEAADRHEIAVEGTRISYVAKGEGEPIVLVHGIPTSSFLWRKMIDELSAHGRVYALDLPGFGLSDPPPDGDYSISNYARVFASFLDALSVDRPTLICHDFGGPIALTYALRHPEKYQRLVILDTFLHNELPPVPLLMKIASIRPFGELLLWLGGKSVVRAALEEGVTDKSQISQQIVDQYYLPQGTPDKLNATMLALLRIDYGEDVNFIEQNLKRIEKPTLIIWAENDKFLPLSPFGERIHQDIPGSTMVRVPDCGHFLQEERPEQATQLIVQFLEDDQGGG